MSLKLSDKKLAVLGAGKLGGILLRAYLKQGLFLPRRVSATVKHREKAAALAQKLGHENVTGSLTLADIFELDKRGFDNVARKGIGFCQT